MPVSYTLKVTQLDCLPQAEGQSDVVYQVHWAYTGVLGSETCGYGGKTTLTYEAGAPFTPYNELTEAQVAGWVMGAWTPEEKAHYEGIIEGQILPKTPLPWGATTTEPTVA